MALSLRSMRYFNTALAHGSIAKAADELNIAASAVATTIDQIEGQLQLKLVNRFRSRGIVATASGKVMERKFARLLDEFDAVIADATDLKQSLKGELKIGYYAPIAPAFLPAILASLSGPDAHITFRLEECDNTRAQEGFLAGEFDAILFVSDAALPQIEYDVLIQAPAYCLVPSEHPLASQSSVQLKDLMAQRLVVLNRPVAVDYYHQLFARTGQTPATIAYANSTEMVRSIVGAGHGIAVLNMLPSADISYAGDRLTVQPILDPLPPLTLSVAYDKSNPRRIVSRLRSAADTTFRTKAGTATSSKAKVTDRMLDRWGHTGRQRVLPLAVSRRGCTVLLLAMVRRRSRRCNLRNWVCRLCRRCSAVWRCVYRGRYLSLRIPSVLRWNGYWQQAG